MKTIILLLSLLSCTNYPITNRARALSSNDSAIKFDFSRIHTLSSKPTKDDLHLSDLPYFVEYENDGRKIIYLSTDHTSKVNSKTHQAIDSILQSFKPEAVIVEVPAYDGELSNEVLDHCDLNTKCVEGLYAYKKSKVLGIPIVGGEPFDSEVLVNSLRYGLTKEELLFFYTFRGVASWRQGDAERAHNPENPEEEINKYIRGNKTRLGLNDIDFTYADFTKLYESKMNKKFNYKDTRYNDIAPFNDGHNIQKLSVVVDKTREDSILKKAEDLINLNSRVFIIYGSGHFLKHRPVLKDAFKSETVYPL